MLKHVENCIRLLSSLSGQSRIEEYSDTLVDLAVHIKHLIEGAFKDKSMTDDILLCFNQISTCLQYLGETGGEPRVSQDVLDYFATRVSYCLMELKSHVSGENCQLTDAPGNCLGTLDLILDLMDTSSMDPDHPKELLDTVDYLLSQVLLFRTIVLEVDKGRLLEMCKCVLTKKVALCELDEGAGASAKTLTYEDLRRSILEMEDLLSNCILTLMIESLLWLQDAPLERLRDALRNGGQVLEDGRFDLQMDRLIQLGLLGMAFTVRGSVKLNIRSALASLESLDLHLLPVVMLSAQQTTTTEPSSDIGGGECGSLRRALERHWLEETAKLSINIHKIIDTKAFCTCLIERISEQLNRSEAQTKAAINSTAAFEGILKMFIVFYQHLSINGIGAAAETSGSGDFVLEHHRKDMKIMLNECKAVLKYANQVEPARIFKRFRLLLHILEKIRRDTTFEEEEDDDTRKIVIELDSTTTAEDIEEWVGGERPCRGEGLLIKQQRVTPGHDNSTGANGTGIGGGGGDEEATDYFKSFGISMAHTSRVFYRQAAMKNKGRIGSNQSTSMIPQLPTYLLSRVAGGNHGDKSRRRGKTVFRGERALIPPTTYAAGDQQSSTNDSLDLNVTEILEQLTKLAETFSA